MKTTKSAAYDYVIVGAGSAGCVLARRLSEDASARVLLVEAGGEDFSQEVHIPAAFSKLFKTEHDWNFSTAPQPHMNRRRLYWPRGKMLGGSSSINAMIYMRGHPADYDGWADATGDASWRYEAVLPYFKKLETNERGASAYHGAGGPLSVADLRDPSPMARAFVRAGIEAGLPFNPDFNGARQEGVGLNQVTQKGGARHSAAAAYLAPVRGRRNLTVLTGAHATRVLVGDGRAIGLAYTRGGKEEETVRARREVILSAGAVGSPHLLMLSGIGPAAHLRERGLPVVRDVPGVGQNLQDHLVAGVMRRSTAPLRLTRAESLPNVFRYLVNQSGPLSSNVAEACAFTTTRPGLAAPDLQFHFAPVSFLDHGLEAPEEDALSIGATLLQPGSRGHLALASPDPRAAPVIQPRYLSDEEDLRVLTEGVKLARKIFAQRSFARRVGEELLPGPAFSNAGEAGLKAYVRERAETIYHPVGTCAMGTDDSAVVDAELRVRGLDGLRVVDASVMPRIVRGNTNVPVIMLAEKAADLISGAPQPEQAGIAEAAA